MDMQHIPGIEIPRANFNLSSRYSTTLDMDYIYPVFWEKV